MRHMNILCIIKELTSKKNVWNLSIKDFEIDLEFLLRHVNDKDAEPSPELTTDSSMELTTEPDLLVEKHIEKKDEDPKSADDGMYTSDSDSDSSYICDKYMEKKDEDPESADDCNFSLDGDNSISAIIEGIVTDSQESSDDSMVIPLVTKKVESCNKIYLSDAIYYKKLLETKGRVYDRVHFCYYCHKKCKKIPEHFKNIHSSEIMVKKYMESVPNSEEANDALTLIRNMGDNQHNQRVINANSGELILPRVPAAGTKISDFTVCTYCFMWTKDLNKHLRIKGRCKAPGEKTIPTIKRPVVVSASKQFQKYVVDRFVKDDVSAAIIADEMLTRLGNDSIAKVQGNKLCRGKYASNKVRMCGKILLIIKKKSNAETNMYGFLSMKYYDLFTDAVKELCVLKDEDYVAPTTAIKAGQQLVELCKIKRDVAAKLMNEHDRKDAKRLMDHFHQRWRIDVTGVAYDNLAERRFNKRILLPIDEDLQALSEHLRTLTAQAGKPRSLDDFKGLVRVVQTRLLLFNKRRPGEIDCIRTIDYIKCMGEEEEIGVNLIETLSDFEKQLMKSNKVMSVRGKRGRGVPIIIPQDVKVVMDVLSHDKIRKRCAVSSIFLFGTCDDSRVIETRGSLERVVEECGTLKYPARIKATLLRKFIATHIQVLSLKKNEMDWVVAHLGHSINIHKDYYRVMSTVVEKCKIAKLLCLADTGNLGQFHGKSIEEIDISPEMICNDTPLQSIDCNESSDEEDAATTPPRKKRKIWSEAELKCYDEHFGACTEYIKSLEIRDKIKNTILENMFQRVKSKLNAQCQKIRKRKLRDE